MFYLCLCPGGGMADAEDLKTTFTVPSFSAHTHKVCVMANLGRRGGLSQSSCETTHILCKPDGCIVGAQKRAQ